MTPEKIKIVTAIIIAIGLFYVFLWPNDKNSTEI